MALSNGHLRMIGICFLLCLALVGALLGAANTLRAYQQFEQHHRRVLAGDVSTISPWMTLHYIAHAYQVPESCLDASLGVSNPALQKHTTLHMLANQDRKPVNSLIRSTQQVILRYRKNQSVCDSPANMARLENPHHISISLVKGEAA